MKFTVCSESDEIVTADHVSAEEGTTYFVDNACHYYYQTGTADGQQVMAVVSGTVHVLSNYLERE